MLPREIEMVFDFRLILRTCHARDVVLVILTLSGSTIPWCDSIRVNDSHATLRWGLGLVPALRLTSRQFEAYLFLPRVALSRPTSGQHAVSS